MKRFRFLLRIRHRKEVCHEQGELSDET
jgi:hypothetical protein